MSTGASRRRLRPFARLLSEAGWELAAEPHVSFTEYVVRGRPVWVPDRLPRLDAASALARVALPAHLNWSAPGRVFDMAERGDCARVYEVVLQEGRPADILTYVDGVLLADLWDDLVLLKACPVCVVAGDCGGGAMTPGTPVGGGSAESGPGLTVFQAEVARLFFGLAEAAASCWPGERPCWPST